LAYEGGTSARPPMLSAAAIVLFMVGGLNLLGALLLFTASSLGGIEVVLALLSLAIGAASIYAAMQILQLRDQGRALGLGIAAVGGILALLSIIRGNPYQIVALLLYGFVLYALVTQAAAFRR
jgi:hypothetical protein